MPIKHLILGVVLGASVLPLREIACQQPGTVSGPSVPIAYTNWLNQNAVAMKTLSSSAATSDLSYLRPTLLNKRLVMLGESAHGTSEFSRAKTRIIRYLHEALGFNVLVFESSYFDCYHVNRHRSVLDAEDMLRGCLYPVWQSEEVLELFEYIKSTEKTTHPLRVAGMDVQETGVYGTQRNALLYRAAARFDTVRAKEIQRADSAASSLIQQQYSGKALVTSFDSLALFRATFDAAARYFDSLAQSGTKSTRDTLLAARETARAMAYFATFRAYSFRPHSTYAERMLAAAARDSGMALILNSLADEEFRGEKLVVWAHNAHIMMDDMSLRDPLGRWPAPSFKVLGSLLAESRGAEMYVVGLHMGSGTAARVDRSVDTVTKADSGSMEAILLTGPKAPAHFLDISRAGRASGTEWLYSEITAKQWGYAKEIQVLRRQYHGLLFLPSSSPAHYLPYQRTGQKKE